jgi:hypothetical protein
MSTSTQTQIDIAIAHLQSIFPEVTAPSTTVTTGPHAGLVVNISASPTFKFATISNPAWLSHRSLCIVQVTDGMILATGPYFNDAFMEIITITSQTQQEIIQEIDDALDWVNTPNSIQIVPTVFSTTMQTQQVTKT